MKSRHKFVIGGVVIFGVLVALSVQGLQEMTVYFYTPQEVLAAPTDFQEKTIRIGALVQPGTVEWDARSIRLAFHITEDSIRSIPVIYEGVKRRNSWYSKVSVLPDLILYFPNYITFVTHKIVYLDL